MYIDNIRCIDKQQNYIKNNCINTTYLAGVRI